jgi:integrase
MRSEADAEEIHEFVGGALRACRSCGRHGRGGKEIEKNGTGRRSRFGAATAIRAERELSVGEFDEGVPLVDDLLRDVAETGELLPEPGGVVVADEADAVTGARRSELIRSRIVDFDDESVVIRERKKSKKQHTIRRVPLTPLLKSVMEEWFKVHPGSPFTFSLAKVSHSKKTTRTTAQPLTTHETQDHFKRALAGSKWDKLRGWHVLRHSFISNCALKGIDQRIIDSFVGHTTEEMRKRYTHLFPSAKKAAIDAVFGQEVP